MQTRLYSASVQSVVSSLTVAQRDQLEMYAAMLMDSNKHTNLTGARSKEDIWYKHILDCLTLVPALDECLAARRASLEGQAADSFRPSLVDVGSGAGFPGLVLALARPDLSVTLVDSRRRRCAFLSGAAQALGLMDPGNAPDTPEFLDTPVKELEASHSFFSNNYITGPLFLNDPNSRLSAAPAPKPRLRVLWCRAEALAHWPGQREEYDVATARAVASLDALAELCLPFVAPGGRWLAPKGADGKEELALARAAVRRLGGGDGSVETVDSRDGGGRRRTLVVVPKVEPTPTQFPRVSL